MSASAGLFGLGGDSWKEEVLLHDGGKMIVKRSQSYGGRHEIGQSSPVKEHTITFTPPGSNNTISWISEYSEDLGRTNFKLLALHLLNGAPYLVVTPNLCLSYNKWGRPNPPYVFFKYDGGRWQRIPLEEFPAEFKTINLIVSNSETKEIKSLQFQSGMEIKFVLAADVRKMNNSLTQSEYKTILREAYPTAAGFCSEMVYDGKGGWHGIGWFRDKPTYAACLKHCEQNKISLQYCPCETLFRRE